MEWTPIAVAATTGAFGLAAVIAPVLLSRKIEKVHAEVRTNHGKPAHEYLEMIEEIRSDQRALFGLLADHTEQDARQFDELRAVVAGGGTPGP